MAYVVGTDEAGYGPNLGPLVIASTAWRVPSLSETPDLYKILRGAVTKNASDGGSGDRILVADSKDVYRAGAGMRGLERGVLGMVASITDDCRTWKELCQTLEVNLPGQGGWPTGFDPALPIEATSTEVATCRSLVHECCNRTGVSLLDIHVSAVFPEEFNARVVKLGTKGMLLSEQSLELVRKVIDSFDEPILVQCDKHGGRNRYAGIIQSYFPDSLPRVCFESRAESRYQIQWKGSPCEFRFCAKGERYLPSALASMVAKYVREISMQALNQFWQAHLPELKPTAGYPMDAKRFKRDIASTQRKLGIADKVLWRQC